MWKTVAVRRERSVGRRADRAKGTSTRGRTASAAGASGRGTDGANGRARMGRTIEGLIERKIRVPMDRALEAIERSVRVLVERTLERPGNGRGGARRRGRRPVPFPGPGTTLVAIRCCDSAETGGRRAGAGLRRTTVWSCGGADRRATNGVRPGGAGDRAIAPPWLLNDRQHRKQRISLPSSSLARRRGRRLRLGPRLRPAHAGKDP